MKEAPNGLPRGWRWAALGEVAKYINGKAFKPSDWEAHGLPIIRIQNLTNRNAEFHFTSKPVEDRYLVQNGDLLISWSATLDAFLWDRGNAVLNQHIFKIIEDGQLITRRYLYHVVRANLRLLKGQVHGTGMQHITRGPFEATRVPLPPLPEQQRIVEKIERLLGQSRTAREALDGIPPLLKRFRQSVLAKAFRGELTERDPSDESASVLLERLHKERRRKWEEDLRARGKDPRKTKYVEPEPPDTSGRPELAEGWAWARLAEVATVKGGKRLPKGSKYAEDKTAHPYVRVTDFRDGSISAQDLKYLDHQTYQRLKRYTISSSDVYMSIAGTIGEVGTVPAELDGANLTENAAKITPIGTYAPRFLALALRTNESLEQIGLRTIATTQPKLALFRIEAIIVPVASIREQNEIVARVEELFGQSEAIAQLVVMARRRAEHVDQAVLARAFRGEL